MKKKSFAIFCGILSLLITFKTHSQLQQNVRGIVLDFNTERPIQGVNFQISANLSTQSDENGAFLFEKVPIGRYSLRVSHLGFETQLLEEVLVEAGKELFLTIKLKEQSSTLQEAVVRGGKPKALTSVQKITIEQVMRFPATFMDPARLALNYAGVAGTNDQANGMVIRGNSPNGLQWRLEGVEIVNPNHLSNAGTFSDRITQSAGGTNILSAQLLGEMDFMTGAFPAEYGNALAGVMDMRLRKGNAKKHEFTTQLGLIGLDLSAEGPLNKRGASYLINYRYSFTGMLAKLGIDFGGESIAFQDVAFNLNVPTKKIGNFTLFGMGGRSSNIYAGKRDTTQWKFQKDGFDIEFRNDMAAAGLTHEISVGRSSKLRSVMAFSGLLSERLAYVLSNTTFRRFRVDADSSARNRISGSSILSHRISSNLSLKEGLFLTHQDDYIFSSGGGLSANGQVLGLIIQPFASAQLNYGQLTANLGLHYLNYTYNKSSSVEPRLSVGYQLSANQSVSAAYGLHSQLQLPQIYFGVLPNRSETNKTLGLSRAHHFVLGHELRFKRNAFLKTEVYLQRMFDIPVVSKPTVSSYRVLPNFSALNLVENFIDEKLENDGIGTNYGIEVTFQKYLTKGFYTLLTGSLYNASYTGGDGKTYNARFNGRHTLNTTFGYEFLRKKNKTLGLNMRAVWLGGFWDSPINEEASRASRFTVYEVNDPFTIRQKDYFRPDLRLYFKRNKAGYTRTFSLDIQNFMNQQNESFSYYDILQRQVVRHFQLGLNPMLNYRLEF